MIDVAAAGLGKETQISTSSFNKNMSCLLPQFKCQPDTFSIHFRTLHNHQHHSSHPCESLSVFGPVVILLFGYVHYECRSNGFVSIGISKDCVVFLFCGFWVTFSYIWLHLNQNWNGCVCVCANRRAFTHSSALSSIRIQLGLFVLWFFFPHARKLCCSLNVYISVIA